MQLVQDIWDEIRSRLQSEKKRLYGAIRSYPTPITGCDEQFNYLLEQRTQLSREWSRLQAVEKQSLAAEDPMAVLVEFVRTSPYLDAEAVIRGARSR